jgi:rhodanese-related sulfurtransferase
MHMRKVFLALVCTAVALPVFAQVADPTTGEYASTIAPGNPLHVAPAIYASTAKRSYEFFSATKGARTLMPATVFAWKSGAVQAPYPYVIVDVRPKAQFDAGHVPGAFNIPLDVLFLPENLALLPTDGTTAIITVCVTGHTGSMALGALVALGYENVYTIRGGTNAWVASGYTLEYP